MQPTLRLTGPRPACADGRFAPSPSGVLHLGNLRTALVAWAIARAQNAAFRLRIDDLDPGRSRRVVADGQLRDLRDIGIDWDGPLIRQSERSAAYADAERDLDAAGLLYRCWCTRAEIRDAVRAPHGPQHDGYPGTCSRLTAAEVAERCQFRTREGARMATARALERLAAELNITTETQPSV